MKKIKERKRIIWSALLAFSVITVFSGWPTTTLAEPVIPSSIESPVVTDDTKEQIIRLNNDSVEEENYGYVPYTGLLEKPILKSTPGLDRATIFPAKLDPRNTSAVTSVKNQYQTGSCWAHAVMAASESSLIKKGQATNTIDLSETHLVYFYYSAPQDPLGNISNDKMTISPDTMASRMIMGGNTVYAAWHLASGSGPVFQSAAPAVTSTSHTDTTTRLDTSVRNSRQYFLKEAKITPFSYENKDAIKKLITEYGGVTVSYYCDQGWEKVAGDTIAYYNPSVTYSNHAVEIVGWDDNYSVSNFAGASQGYVPAYTGAWLCKNSWGTDASRKDGFFWMSYDTTVINAECVAFSYDDNTRYKNIYQYDGAKAGGYYNGGDITFTNIYTAKGNPDGLEVIDAVGLGVGANGTYQIKVYVNPVIVGNKLQSYEYVSEAQEFSSVYQGYYTVPLEDPIYLDQGETFAVAVTAVGESKVLCSSNNTHTDEAGTYTEEDVRLPGQSYYITGTYWMDNQSGATPRIKALTNPVAKPTTSVTVTLSESEIFLKHFPDKGETKQLIATLSPQDAEGAIRYTSSDDSVATVSSGGLVTAVGSGSCMIYAEYIDGTAASCEVTVEDYAALTVRCELDGETWDGDGHVFTLQDEEGDVYENGAYVSLGKYTIYDNGENTGRTINITRAVAHGITLNYFTYTFYDYDGSVLHTQEGLESKTPKYEGAIPSRPDDEEYSYTFSGWSPLLSGDTKEYTAQYIQSIKPQKITIELRKDSVVWNTVDAPKIEFASATDLTKIYQNGEAAPAGQYYVIVDGEKTKYMLTSKEKQEFSGVLDFYTATFFSDEGGELLQRKAYLPGDIPAYEGDIPTKASDGTYNYTFSGWSDTIEPMGTEPVEYIACYTQTYCDKYVEVSATLDGVEVDERISLHMMNTTDADAEDQVIYENGSMVPVGAYEIYLDEISIQRYILVSPGKDIRTSVELFTVIYENDDHTVLQKNYVVSGDAAEYKGDTPKKAADNVYSYTFDKWSDNAAYITEPTTYTALYHKSALPQKVNIQTSLSSNEIPTAATVDISLHSLAEEQEIYKNGESVPIGEYAVYVNGRDVNHMITVSVGEVYEETLQFYLIRFVDEVSNQLLKEEYYMEGEMPSIEDDLLYEYEDNEYYRYEILGWDSAFEEVVASKTYLFQCNVIPIVRELQITCYLNDVLWESSGDNMPDVPQVQAIHIPTREVFENYSDNLPVGEYEIWVNSCNSGETLEVKSDSGLYCGVLNFYTVTFEDDMGNVLQSQNYLQNALPVFEGEVPYKADTNQVCYSFLGWDKEIGNVTNKISYKAIFSESLTLISIKYGDEVRYFSDMEEAIAFADSVDNPVFVLERDLENLILSGQGEIRIDLNGYSILEDVCITTPSDEENVSGTKLYLTNSKATTLSRVHGNVIMGNDAEASAGSYLYNDVMILGSVVAGSIDNDGYINCVKVYTDTLTNFGEISTVLSVEKEASLVNKSDAQIDTIETVNGDCINEGKITTIKENYGNISNTGVLQTIVLHKGELQNTYENLLIREDHPHKISFYDGETLLDSFTVYASNGFMYPYIDINKDGYTFLGWAMESDLTKIYPSGTLSGSVVADYVNYYAMWEKLPDSQGTDTSQNTKPNEPDSSHKDETTKEESTPDIQDYVTVGNIIYRYVEGEYVVYSVSKKNKTSYTIPATIHVNGKKYSIKTIASGAFKNCTKAKKIVVGKNVTTIEKNVFKGCKKLKTVTIKSKKLRTVHKKAFKGVSKITIKVPKAKKKSYTKLLKKKLPKGSKIK